MRPVSQRFEAGHNEIMRGNQEYQYISSAGWIFHHPKSSKYCMADSVRPHVWALEIILLVSPQLSQYSMCVSRPSVVSTVRTKCSRTHTYACDGIWQLPYQPNFITGNGAELIALNARTALGKPSTLFTDMYFLFFSVTILSAC